MLVSVRSSMYREYVSDVIPQEESANNVSTIRSFDEALQIAQSSISLVDGTGQTRSGSPRKIDLNNWKIFENDLKTRANSNSNDTLMYVFNFEDNQGFAIVSASKETEGLIAVTESGSYDPSTSSDIDGFNIYMDMAKEYIQNSMLQANGERLAPTPFRRDSLVYHHNKFGPYINVYWGQTHPEGEFCPNGVAGCSITATAQIMSYYQTPTSIDLTYENADRPTQYLNWSNIRFHLTKDYASECFDTVSHFAIGRLCRQLGELANSTYNPATDSTSASTSTNNGSLRLVFQGLGWNTGSWSSYDVSDVVTAINNYHPLLVYGKRVKPNGEESGHVWILDGYDDLETVTYRYELVMASNEWILTNVITSNERLFHLNWGWYGRSNGYFAANVFNASAVRFPDRPLDPVTYNYTGSISTLLTYPN